VNGLYDDQLNLRANGNGAEIAILDLGFNTLGLCAIANGQVSERHIGGAEVDVHRLLDLLVNYSHDPAEIDLALHEGTIRPEARQLNMWLGEILDDGQQGRLNFGFKRIKPCFSVLSFR
jgi:hypothetical protein